MVQHAAERISGGAWKHGEPVSLMAADDALLVGRRRLPYRDLAAVIVALDRMTTELVRT
jgi:hypothetical protein